ncbi:MAG TPA: adenylate/guanylate cyclase domain-containing protein [Planctomycetota bacterium]
MRFRTKLFLAILLPAIALVSGVVGTALWGLNRASEAAATADFNRMRDAVGRLIDDFRQDLKDDVPIFRVKRFRQIVKEAYDTRDYPELTKAVEYELAASRRRAEYVGFVRDASELWYRRFQGRSDGRVQPVETAWLLAQPEGLFVAEGRPVLAQAIAFEEEGGFIVIGRDLGVELERLSRTLNVQLAFLQGGRVLYRSLENWTPGEMKSGIVTLDGRRFLQGYSRVEKLGEVALLLLRSTQAEDELRTYALLAGTGGLLAAGVIAAFVSVVVARGTSKPVEKLVDATKKVAAGDYESKSGVSGADELGRLGAAFDEMTEGLRKRRDIMEKTLSKDVAEEMMKGTELGGERREVTVVFMDIRGFTSGTQGVDPTEVVTMLNDMMNHLTAAIDRHGGNVNKYLGDGLMAMFGAPKPLEDHALRAARAGLEMQRALAAWNARRVEKRLPLFHTGIGINTGLALCGRVGSKDRLEYTLIGEEVNLASRVCGKAEPRQVLATEATVARFRGELKVRALEPVQVKGISYPVKVYEVLG